MLVMKLSTDIEVVVAVMAVEGVYANDRAPAMQGPKAGQVGAGS